ncbi:MAG TPA: SDR family NAD(P)-dependent oxidoreductase [Mycobacteriales bacterium]|nr:SDR family NAD(P)-dependent oxidoreductase [Mycobacteriales bacterium]
MHLDGAVLLVTGASGGIGKVLVPMLRARGAQLLLSARHAEAVTRQADDAGCIAIPADLAQPGGAAKLAAEARSVHGRVDGVIHAAGVGWRGPAQDTEPDVVDTVLAVDLAAPIALTNALLPDLVTVPHSHVCFVSSIAGMVGVAQESLYAAAKAGVLRYAESLRLELADRGVEVSAVSPAAVPTTFFAHRGAPYHRRHPRPLQPVRVATAIVAGIEAGGGYRVVPRWMGVVPRLRALVPGPYEWLARRMD